jgi:hypothetical protein
MRWYVSFFFCCSRKITKLVHVLPFLQLAIRAISTHVVHTTMWSAFWILKTFFLIFSTCSKLSFTNFQLVLAGNYHYIWFLQLLSRWIVKSTKFLRSAYTKIIMNNNKKGHKIIIYASITCTVQVMDAYITSCTSRVYLINTCLYSINLAQI